MIPLPICNRQETFLQDRGQGTHDLWVKTLLVAKYLDISSAYFVSCYIINFQTSIYLAILYLMKLCFSWLVFWRIYQDKGFNGIGLGSPSRVMGFPSALALYILTIGPWGSHEWSVDCFYITMESTINKIDLHWWIADIVEIKVLVQESLSIK
jgi:hypothetical protein